MLKLLPRNENANTDNRKAPNHERVQAQPVDSMKQLKHQISFEYGSNVTSNSEEFKIDYSDRSFDAGFVYKNMKKDITKTAKILE